MLTVFDLSCAGLRDPKGVCGRPALSWRLGSNRPAATQVAYRVVVTSMEDGRARWDTGWVDSASNVVTYAGDKLAPGETCVWFVSVQDDAGEVAHAAPSAFACGFGASEPASARGDQRTALVWTSDPELDARLSRAGADEDLHSELWSEVLGLRLADESTDVVRVAPKLGCPLARGLSFAQGSALIGRGLLVVRWESASGRTRLRVVLPPGVRGSIELPGRRAVVPSGAHELACGRVRPTSANATKRWESR